MTAFDRLKQLDPTKLDLTRFDVRNLEMPTFGLPKLDVSKIELPKFDLPKFDLPAMELPKFDLPRVDLPKVEVPVERITGFARDAAYVGVGAAVVAVRAADERRREVTDQVTSRARKLVDAIG